MAGAHIFNPLGVWLLQSASANGISGTALDCRNAANYAFMLSECTGHSAIFDVLASPDGANWNTALSVTATNGGTATAQVSAFYPYVMAAARSIFSGAGGSAQLHVYYQPGLAI